MYVLRYDPNTGKMVFGIFNDAGTAQYISVDKPSIGWHYFATKWSASEMALFIDGVKVGYISNPNLPTNFADTVLSIGCRPDSPYDNVNTLIDDLRISSIARTDAEISDAYNSGLPLLPDKDTTWWSGFDNNTIFTPSAHKSTHASGGSDALTPADIGAVNKAGDTMTDMLTVPSLKAQINIPSSSPPSAWPAGFVAGIVYNNGYPVSYGTIFSYKGTSGNSCVQLLQAWPDTDGGEAYLYIRSSRDTGADMFGPWRKVWSENNDGTGSGLDADTVDGVHVTGSGSTGLRKITTSTSSPSGGSDGDIWIQYS